MQFWISTVAGVAFTIAGAGETFMAVLYPRAINGPITATVNRVFHRLLKLGWIAGCRFIVAAGPALIVTQVLCWATLLLAGVSLIVWPQLGTGITARGCR
ncbi:hypothetical protein LF1_07570 [Rubripirellula obstinata]|uniref:Uncharacterized protein n=2 Tax=Rubripirellula obstinata TaxID=406547 RepID=A0A5B1CDD4_9BACT|nr:hypothetical protein [Rubripirellula obstinata]KAA1258241.1 hypothetical protein LF1_07570 [Rubripirellula obstinata]